MDELIIAAWSYRIGKYVYVDEELMIRSASNPGQSFTQNDWDRTLRFAINSIISKLDKTATATFSLVVPVTALRFCHNYKYHGIKVKVYPGKIDNCVIVSNGFRVVGFVQLVDMVWCARRERLDIVPASLSALESHECGFAIPTLKYLHQIWVGYSIFIEKI